jgi:predicted transcriptional regulator of viral defense system
MYISVYYLLMTTQELKAKVKLPIFSRTYVVKLFLYESQSHINTQLHRMIKRGDIFGLKRGVYSFPDAKLDEFVVANKLYVPSYVSLESVLNSSGIIPDIAPTVTSVTTVTSKKLTTPLGSFTYSKINKDLFFGYRSVLDQQSGLYYNIARPEKAFLDYIYIRRIRSLDESRADMSNMDKKLLFNYAVHFPKWVLKVIDHA